MIDHIEQAPREFWELLLQITVLGAVTTPWGQRISFRNTVVVMTTRIGVHHIPGAGEGPRPAGTEMGPTEEEIRKRILDEAERHFWDCSGVPFLNRGVDDLIVFQPCG
jgi:ATP-dependent Clp protease ATP-binding subunit ClpB